MYYFFAVLILGLCGGMYYEYTTAQQDIAANQQQIADLHTKIDDLEAHNQKLQNDNAQMTAQVQALMKQVQSNQSAALQTQQQPFQTSSTNSATAGITSIPATGNNLGTFGTTDGKTFLNCQLLKVQADGIVVSSTSGITQVPYSVMPAPLQKRFGYDPTVAVRLSDAQVETLEEQRKAAAGQTSGN